jgi:hypothetical protein
MSPVGRALLSMCDNNLVIDLDKVVPLFPNLNKGRIKTVALMLGLSIKGGS